MNKALRKSAVFVAALMAIPASAEVLPTSGVYPARSDVTTKIDTIAIEALDGSQGAAQRFILRDRLERVQIEGQPWLRIVPRETDGTQTTITGSVGHDSLREELDDKEVEDCVKKNAEKECIKYRTTFVPCNRLTVRLYPDLSMLDREGRELLGFSARMVQSEDYCEDDDDVPSKSEMLDALHNDLASDIRREIAPVHIFRDIRILERRKGLVKEDRSAFKDAVRMTKNDALAACMVFEGLEARNPNQASVLFNIGLCKEGSGELDAAAEYYTRTQAVAGEKSYINEAFDRVELFRRGERQLELREQAFTRDETLVQAN
ncbi:MAG: hypothetical protein ABJ242_11140 [Marinomonas sp.]